MSRSMQFARSIPVDDSWDVIVAGGGPAGCTAAAAAAREGARTLLLEQTGSLGGMGTSGLIPAWCPFSDQQRIIYSGLAEKVFVDTKRGMSVVKPQDTEWVAIDVERLKRVYDALVTNAGATVLFNTFMSGVETDQAGKVSAVVVSNKSGLSAKSAKVFVDCTGDADLCAWAGAEFHKGDDRGGDLMPGTLCFILSNVNIAEYQKAPNMHGANKQSVIHAIMASGKYPEIPDIHMCQTWIGPGTVGFNAGHVYNVDGTDPASVSAALMQGRRIAEAYRKAFAEFMPAAFGQAHLVATGSLLGIRETRRVVGDYVLTLEDYLQRRTFADEIARNNYFIDVHPHVIEELKKFDDAMKWEKRMLRYDKGEAHGIPYRCLTPRDLKNVLVAGRSVSAEQIVQGSIRTMPCCLVMGEAAGLAAALAARGDGNAHRVDTDHLRRRLREEGGYLPEVATAQSAAV